MASRLLNFLFKTQSAKDEKERDDTVKLIVQQLQENIVAKSEYPVEIRVIAERYQRLIQDKFTNLNENFIKAKSRGLTDTIENYWRDQWLDIRDLCHFERKNLRAGPPVESKEERKQTIDERKIWLFDRLLELIAIPAGMEEKAYVPPVIPPPAKKGPSPS